MKNSKATLILAIGVLMFLFGYQPYAYSGGLIGDLVESVGKHTRIGQIEDLGRNMDEEHRRVKENNPTYKRSEEWVTNTVKRPFTVACGVPFQTLTNAVIARCSNWDGRTEGQDLIQKAKQILVDGGIFNYSDFNGVQIRWCPLSDAHGMAPDRGRIYLDTAEKNSGMDNIVLTLAHEMKHIQQYRRMGTDRFKCVYSQDYLKCGNCQNNNHPLEREAYNFENDVYNHLTSNQQPQYNQPQRIGTYGQQTYCCDPNTGQKVCAVTDGNSGAGYSCYCTGVQGNGISCY